MQTVLGCKLNESQEMKELAMYSKSKQTPLKIRFMVKLKDSVVGLCPTCGHALQNQGHECSHCFQKIKW